MDETNRACSVSCCLDGRRDSPRIGIAIGIDRTTGRAGMGATVPPLSGLVIASDHGRDRYLQRLAAIPPRHIWDQHKRRDNAPRIPDGVTTPCHRGGRCARYKDERRRAAGVLATRTKPWRAVLPRNE